MKVLFAGCGDIAQRAISKLQPLNAGHQSSDGNDRWQILGMRRHIEKIPAGIDAIAGDVRDSKALRKLLASEQIDILVVTLTPSEMSDEGYRNSYVMAAEAIASAEAALIEANQYMPRLVMWVSSTGVYGQNQGEWVDEHTEANPISFRGKRLLEAENIIRGLKAESVIVRFSGIYGPGRSRLINQVRKGQFVPEGLISWTNRIHSEDCAGVIEHLLKAFSDSKHLHSCYVATDNEPVPAYEVRKWIAAELGVPFNGEGFDASGLEGGSEGGGKGDSENDRLEKNPNQGRRCSNQRLRDSGYEFLFPSYRQGYVKENINSV